MAAPDSTARWLAAGVAAAALVTFAPALNNGFVWDDHRLLETSAPELASPDAWRHAFTHDFWYAADANAHRAGGDHRLYRPLLKLVVIVEFGLFGTANAVGYHAISLVLHALCGVLVFRWLRRRVGTDSTPGAIAAFAGAMVFVLHPTRVESVSWISGASDLWAALFVLIALEIWDSGQSVDSTAIATGAFLCALLFKEAAAAAPIALAADALLIERPGTDRWNRVRRAAVPIMATLAAFSARLLIVPLRGGAMLRNVGSRPARFFASAGQFVRMTLWPFRPSTQVGYLRSSAFDEAPTYPAPIVVLGIVVLVVILGVAAWAILRRPALRPVVADLGWFWILALPTLNVIPLAGIQYTAERLLYLPGIGMAALVARAAVAIARKPEMVRRGVAAAFVVLLLSFGAVTRAHTSDFESELKLWQSEHDLDPTNGFVLEALYTAAVKTGRYDLAAQTAQEELSVQPTPKGKAFMVVQWLRAEVEAERDDPAALKQLRAGADALAEGRLEGAAGKLAADLPAAGLEWLRTAPVLTITRAWLALRTLDFDRAAALSDACRSDVSSRDMAWRVGLMARVGQGKWDDADRLAAEPGAPGQVAGILKSMELAAAQQGAADWVARVTAIYQLGEMPVAHAFGVSLLDVFPRSEELVRAIVNIDVNRRDYAEARRLIEQDRGFLNTDWIRQMTGLIDQTERAGGQ